MPESAQPPDLQPIREHLDELKAQLDTLSAAEGRIRQEIRTAEVSIASLQIAGLSYGAVLRMALFALAELEQDAETISQLPQNSGFSVYGIRGALENLILALGRLKVGERRM